MPILAWFMALKVATRWIVGGVVVAGALGLIYAGVSWWNGEMDRRYAEPVRVEYKAKLVLEEAKTKKARDELLIAQDINMRLAGSIGDVKADIAACQQSVEDLVRRRKTIEQQIANQKAKDDARARAISADNINLFAQLAAAANSEGTDAQVCTRIRGHLRALRDSSMQYRPAGTGEGGVQGRGDAAAGAKGGNGAVYQRQ